jgi:hypothetical protein
LQRAISFIFRVLSSIVTLIAIGMVAVMLTEQQKFIGRSAALGYLITLTVGGVGAGAVGLVLSGLAAIWGIMRPANRRAWLARAGMLAGSCALLALSMAAIGPMVEAQFWETSVQVACSFDADIIAFADADRSGTRSNDEMGLEGIRLELWRAGNEGEGAVVAATQTDADGHARISLHAGQCDSRRGLRLAVVVPEGWRITARSPQDEWFGGASTIKHQVRIGLTSTQPPALPTLAPG